MRAVDALAVSILILGSTGCASLDSVEPKAGQELRPFAVGWEQFFTIDWQPTERKGQPALEGMRSEERRVGKECRSRSGGRPNRRRARGIGCAAVRRWVEHG